MTTNYEHLSLYLVEDGEVSDASPSTEWSGDTSVLIAATSPEAALIVASGYDEGRVQVDNLIIDGRTVACAFMRDEDDMYI